MKKLILALTLVAFALMPAAQAGESKSSAKNKAACSDKTKADCSAKTVSVSSCGEKSACCAKEKTAQKKVLSPKAASLAKN
jgi:hypothetical protein